MNQLESNPVVFKRLTDADITEALVELSDKYSENNYTLYCNTETAEIFIDFGNKKKITVYGVKLIGRHKGMFTYEGVLFDKFPKEYNMLFVNYLNKQGLERCEEIEIVELTDTKIVFEGSFRLPADINNFIVE
ncbi:MAG: hypothetical protein J6T10_12690 [Methanobrevibacter sp.]|nr:hypothetical protein [Methanobrevibacter sp.]